MLTDDASRDYIITKKKNKMRTAKSRWQLFKNWQFEVKLFDDGEVGYEIHMKPTTRDNINAPKSCTLRDYLLSINQKSLSLVKFVLKEFNSDNVKEAHTLIRGLNINCVVEDDILSNPRYQPSYHQIDNQECQDDQDYQYVPEDQDVSCFRNDYFETEEQFEDFMQTNF